MKHILFVTMAMALLPAGAPAQDTAELQRLFEAGNYQAVVDAVPEGAAPPAVYDLAQAHQRLDNDGAAIEAYGRLAARPESDAWHFIGLSGQQLVQDQLNPALQSAQRAVAMAGNLAEAHYQLGLVQARREQWAMAATAFDRAGELNPANAYAHYYAGLMYYRAGRPDRMAVEFEQFLKRAPDAPERPEVMQIMRTIRGR